MKWHALIRHSGCALLECHNLITPGCSPALIAIIWPHRQKCTPPDGVPTYDIEELAMLNIVGIEAYKVTCLVKSVFPWARVTEINHNPEPDR